MMEYHVEYRIEVEASTPEDAVALVAGILASGGAERGSYHVMPFAGEQMPLRPGEIEIDLDLDERECSRCGDEVQILNSRDECSACEEARSKGRVCSRCAEDISPDDMHSHKKGGLTICGSCVHNEKRSGGGPGSLMHELEMSEEPA